MTNIRSKDAKSPDSVRRRVAKSGLAIPVVLSTLGSKPVFGEVAYNCTISGQMSGNTSAPGPPVVCAIGDGPSDYLTNGTADLDAAFNSLTSGGSTLVNAIESIEPNCTAPNQTVNEPEVVAPVNPPAGRGRGPRRGFKWKPGDWKPTAGTDLRSYAGSTARVTRVAGTSDSRLFPEGGRRLRRGYLFPEKPPISPPTPEINAIPGDTCPRQQPAMPRASEPTLVVDARDRRSRWGWRKPATLRQVLESQDGGIIPLAQATIASYLNARRFAPDYALTPKQVIDMFNAVYVSGSYRVNESTLWGANEVQTYFETLFR